MASDKDEISRLKADNKRYREAWAFDRAYIETLAKCGAYIANFGKPDQEVFIDSATVTGLRDTVKKLREELKKRVG